MSLHLLLPTFVFSFFTVLLIRLRETPKTIISKKGIRNACLYYWTLSELSL